jgi:heme/copper-type cytochrome/quinol oxidase subunit 3
VTAPAEVQRRDRSTSWWGMVFLIATEAALFAVVLFSALYLRFSATPAWPPPGVESPKLGLPLAMTVVLVSSSIPVQLAVRAARGARWGATRWWMFGGALLGLAFLTLQTVEYRRDLDHFRPSDDSYASMFYTATGLHGVHVVIGVALLVWCATSAASARNGAGTRTVENVVLYWHFVDVVWLGVFATMYWAVAR